MVWSGWSGGVPRPPPVVLWVCGVSLGSSERATERGSRERERKQERDRENQERRSKTSKDIKRRIPKIIEKTKAN